MKVSPSLLSADFGNIARDVEMLNRSSADMIHLDVMDGVFVPNISFGFPVIEAVCKVAQKPLDVHLMIVEPQKYITQVRDCGAAIMNVHQEACVHLHRTVEAIKKEGMKAAVTLNPSTPVCMLEDIISDLDMVLLMSVNPGFGGQKYIEDSTDKIIQARQMLKEEGVEIPIQVDGGINEQTLPLVLEAGASRIVAGSYVFGGDMIENIKKIQEIMDPYVDRA